MSGSNSHDKLAASSVGEAEKNLVAAITLRIRQSLDLGIILDRTVAEVRNFFQVDRVAIYRFEPDWSGIVVTESIRESADSIAGIKIKDPCFKRDHLEQYRQGRIHSVNDVATANLTPCYANVLDQYSVRANLVVPIVAQEELWGLLFVHDCHAPRHWQPQEIALLKQLAIQVGIAVQQAELYEQVQSFNVYLEQKIEARTTNLENSVKFETLIRKINEKMRDSLDEPQILQTVTQEIGRVLNVDRCKIELYNGDRNVATIAYEYAVDLPNCQGASRLVHDFPAYQQLLEKQSLQFVEIAPELSPQNTQATRLVCPIFDDRGTLGNLWLLRPREEYFEKFEVMLVEQIASQCAIAIRQARLYQQSQIQIKELARLNIVKDDFLKTISHELRTPMSSIQLASETLEALLEQEIGANKSATFNRVLDIFRSACQRQNQLVDDLLTLCYIDSKKEILKMQWIDLALWLPQIIAPFTDRLENQKQKLVIDINANFPQFKSDISSIKRILSELLNNACKYTPATETITITAVAITEGVRISVSNTGVEIPLEEQERVFDKFYRIPHHDPWQFGGTGIGLALSRNIIKLLNGELELVCEPQKTIFSIFLPCETIND